MYAGTQTVDRDPGYGVLTVGARADHLRCHADVDYYGVIAFAEMESII